MRGFNYDLSEEAVLECAYRYNLTENVSDCSGMHAFETTNMLASVGNVLSASYPYTAQNLTTGTPTTEGICEQARRIKWGEGTVVQKSMTLQELKDLIAA